MYDRRFSGLKLSSAVLMLLLITAGLYFGACSSDKGEKKEAETNKAEVESPAEQKPTHAPVVTGQSSMQSREGLPPEITEPCSGKNEGDECTVVLTGGGRITGKCTMTRKNILGCKPTPIIGHPKQAPGVNPTDNSGDAE